MEKINLVAVYGSLRKSMSNHYLLMGSEFIGTFSSDPSYTMYGVGVGYPAVVEGGCTSIVMEVYSVDKEIEKKLDRLEGYNENNEDLDNYYNKVLITTPFGDAYVYIFNEDVTYLNKIESGDWLKQQEEVNSKKFNLYN